MKLEVMMGAQINDMLAIGEFRGSFPDVPIAEGVDIDGLRTDGDDDPMFVTLPVGKFGAVSGNRRHYSEAVMRELVRQINDKRPVARMGHLKDDERSSAHPLPAGYWVGATIQGDTVYGKAYIPKGAVREYFRTAKRVGQKIGTSLYGLAEQVYDKAKGVYDVVTLDLESIDFGAPERIGVKALASVPIITAEMRQDDNESEDEMGKFEIIQELTATDAGILPDAVKQAVIEASPATKTLATLAELVGGDDVVNAVKALVTERDTMREQAIADAITSTVSELVAIESVRPLVTQLVQAKAPDSVSAVKGVVAEIVGQDAVKALLADNTMKQAGAPLKVTEAETQGDGGGMLSADALKAISEFSEV